MTELRRNVRRVGVAGVTWLVLTPWPVLWLHLSGWFWLGPSVLLLGFALVFSPFVFLAAQGSGAHDPEGIEGRDARGWLATVLPLGLILTAVVLSFVAASGEQGCSDTPDEGWTGTVWAVAVTCNVLALLACAYSLTRRRWFVVLVTLGGVLVCIFSAFVSTVCWN